MALWLGRKVVMVREVKTEELVWVSWREVC